ncbi:hypothetical protein JVT61DRAFT_14998 [Boletus reticuloceps]|uniref:Uncharacterized protein n=1 Tax=Boletus reticuloceps TaxID=495285 RepID=A0A8I3A260_9AGAM|nr:hypothetical protein JVT61DRAFT_14998 [Boletus reticuloceps]
MIASLTKQESRALYIDKLIKYVEKKLNLDLRPLAEHPCCVRTSPYEHYHVSTQSRTVHNLSVWLQGYAGDRAIKHLGEDLQFSDDDRDMLLVAEDKIYEHRVLRVNYITYDLQREQDSVTTTHPDVMVLSQETDEARHPYWYACIIHIFHVNVCYYGEGNNGEDVKRFNILFVRWCGRATHLPSGFAARRLPKLVSYIKMILTCVHLIPSFRQGTTDKLLRASFVHRESNDDEDWNFYDVNIFVDHDMFMQFHGCGIGHKGSRHWDEFLLSDGAKVQAEADEEVEEDIADKGSDDEEVERPNIDQDGLDMEHVPEDNSDGEDDDSDRDDSENEEHESMYQMDKEDPIVMDDDEILDDHVLIQEGYGAL